MGGGNSALYGEATQSKGDQVLSLHFVMTVAQHGVLTSVDGHIALRCVTMCINNGANSAPQEERKNQ